MTRKAAAPATTETTRWTISIDSWLPPSLNRLFGHWAKAARIKRAARDMIVLEAYRAEVPKACGCRRRVSITLTIVNRSHAPDPDNVWKGLLDALKHAGLIVDDRAEFCVMGPVTIVRGSRKRTEIVLEDLA